MKISVITVVYNGEALIERTLESVLNQNYDCLEYWIIDGASTDSTLEKVKEYAPRFEERGIELQVLSEPDKGIYDAMNKGIGKATGEVIGIINCGDVYALDALATVAKTFNEKECELMFGDLLIYTRKGKKILKKAVQKQLYQSSRHWNHPTMFVKSRLYKTYPFPNKGIHDDYGFYLKMRKQRRRIAVVNQTLAVFWMGGASNEKKGIAACKRIHDRYQYCYRDNGYSRWYLTECILIEAAKWFLG